MYVEFVYSSIQPEMLVVSLSLVCCATGYGSRTRKLHIDAAMVSQGSQLSAWGFKRFAYIQHTLPKRRIVDFSTALAFGQKRVMLHLEHARIGLQVIPFSIEGGVDMPTAILSRMISEHLDWDPERLLHHRDRYSVRVFGPADSRHFGVLVEAKATKRA